MTHGFDADAVIKSTVKKILAISILSMIVYINSKSLYDCLVRLGTTQEKRFMVDIMCLKKAYERREITEIRWIDGKSNPADAMTKGDLCDALERLISTNIISVRASGWVEREKPPNQLDTGADGGPTPSINHHTSGVGFDHGQL